MKVVLSVACALGLLSSAHAGIVLTYTNQDHTSSRASESRVYFQKGSVRMEGGPGPAGTVIAREDRILVMQDDKKTYYEITAKELAQISKMVDSMGDVLKREMKKLNPEQRKQMEQMGLSSAGFEMPEILYKKTASGVKCGVGGAWTCDAYDVVVAGKKTAEKHFTADIGAGAEFNASQFQKLLEKVASSGLVQKAKDKIKGHPQALEVTSKDYFDGRLVSEHSLKSVERRELAASLFEVPAGYKKETMPTLPTGAPFGSGGSRGQKGR